MLRIGCRWEAEGSVTQPNHKYYLRLKNPSDHYTHQVSRKIVDFCVREEARVIVIPPYDKGFLKIVQYRLGMYSPLYLGSRIREFLKYKAWSAGIVVLELSAERHEQQMFCLRRED